MNSKLNTQDIVDLLFANYEISKEEAETFIVEFISLIEKGLSSDELVKVKDFGTFKLTRIQERESIDVNTQEKIVIPSHRRVSFVPASMLKELVNKPFAHFETTPLNDGIFLDGISQDVSSDNDDEDKTDEDDETNEIPTDNTDSVVAANPIIEAFELEEIEPLLLPATSSVEKSVEPLISKENPISDNEKVDSPTKSIVGNTKKPKSRKKLRRFILRWDVAVAVIIIFGIGFAYNYYFTKNKPSTHGVEESDIPKPIKDVSPALAENNAIERAVVVQDSVVTMKRTEAIKTVKMLPGITLRLIALDKLGNREFWVYIYLKNKDKIKNPDVVPVGLELVMPSEGEFDMDADNPSHVSKAKGLGDQEMKKFW